MPKYRINSEEKVFDHPLNITQLATELGLMPKGLAIAVNNKIVPKATWDEVILQENDNVVIIKAACGG